MISQDVRQSFSAGTDAASAPKPELTPQQRLELARQELILPWAMRLSQFDHLAEVYVVGGASNARNQPTSAESNLEYYYSGLNHGSDLDVIVISPRLLTPKHYVRFLEDLSRSAADFAERHGLHPVFFCHSTSKHTRVSLVKAFHGPDVVPIHFLFYPSADAFYFREGALAERLSNKASVVVRRDVPPSEGTDSWPSSGPMRRACSWKFHRCLTPEQTQPEDLPYYSSFASSGSEYPRRAAVLRWDLECLVADFVLNYPAEKSPRPSIVEFLKGEFAESVRKSFRNFNLSFTPSENRRLGRYDSVSQTFVSKRNQSVYSNPTEAISFEERERYLEAQEKAADRQRLILPSAPPSHFGHSMTAQQEVLHLACQVVGQISLGDFRPERGSILRYGQLLLESCFVSRTHRESFLNAVWRSYAEVSGLRNDRTYSDHQILGDEGPHGEDPRFWELADTLSSEGELRELTHVPLREYELWSTSCDDPTNVTLVVTPGFARTDGGCPQHLEDVFRAPYQGLFEQRQEKIRQIALLLTDDDVRMGLMSTQSDVRARAIECWGSSVVAPELVDLIVQVAQEDDSRVRAWALDALARRAPSSEHVARFVASQLKDVELSVGLVALAAAESVAAVKIAEHTRFLVAAAWEAYECPRARHTASGARPELNIFLSRHDPSRWAFRVR
jgi:hypothetical protein